MLGQLCLTMLPFHDAKSCWLHNIEKPDASQGSKKHNASQTRQERKGASLNFEFCTRVRDVSPHNRFDLVVVVRFWSVGLIRLFVVALKQRVVVAGRCKQTKSVVAAARVRKLSESGCGAARVSKLRESGCGCAPKQTKRLERAQADEEIERNCGVRK